MRERDWDGDLLVIGAGPGGLAVAAECARHGLRILTVDENQRPGGQIARQRFLDPGEAAARGAGAEPLIPAGVTFRPETVCHGFDGSGRAVLSRHGELFHARAERVVLATGATEKILPVPGWTLPGVMTAGAAQTFLKGSGIFPYKRVLVAGTGPILLAVASQLIQAGIRVAGVVEAARPGHRQWPDAARTLAAPRLVAQGAGYATRLLRAGVRVRVGTGVRRIEGNGEVTGVCLGRLRGDWSFADEPGEHVACDAVLLNHGFSSATELAAQRGADIEWDEQRLTWRPVRDGAFRTTVAGVHAVGDCAGVGGAQIAELEGRIAGAVISAELTGQAYDRRRLRLLRGRLSRLETFRGGMDRLFAPGPGAASWPAARTPVCRCQEVPRAELDEAIAHGAADLHSLKLWTRAGMGPCQARICGPVMSLLLAARGHEIARLAPVSVRFPVRPLPLGALCHPRNHREGEHDHEDVRVADQRLRD